MPDNEWTKAVAERDRLRDLLKLIRMERNAAQVEVDRLRADRDGWHGQAMTYMEERDKLSKALGEAMVEIERLRLGNGELVATLEAAEPFMRVWLKKFPTGMVQVTQVDANRICDAISKGIAL